MERGFDVRRSTGKQDWVYGLIPFQEATRSEREAYDKELLEEAEGGFGPYDLEKVPEGAGGLIIDAVTSMRTIDRPVYLEFHHKSEGESSPNKISIYLLEKLKEYAINYGITSR